MVNLKTDKKAGKYAVYCIIGVNCDGRKDCFGFWIGENEGTHRWLSIEYPSEIRKMIYTANAIESFNSAMRKVTNRKAAFPNEMAVLKILYLRTLDMVHLATMSSVHSYRIFN